MICEKCGTQLDDDALFCHKCGHQIAISGNKTQDPPQNPIDGSTDTAPLMQEDVIRKQKKTTQAMAITAIVLFATACVIIVLGILDSKPRHMKSNLGGGEEPVVESADTGESEEITPDKADTKNLVEKQDEIDEKPSEDETLAALKEMDSILGNYIWVIIDNKRAEERDNITIKLTDAEMIRASVLASNSDGKIDGEFIYKNNSLELYEGPWTDDYEMYRGVSVSRDDVEKNCKNLFGCNANWDALQTTMENPSSDAVKFIDKGDIYALRLSVQYDSDTDQESHEFRVKEVDNGYKGEVELFWGYWGVLQENPGYSDYMVTYELIPCSLSEYGFAISSITIKKIGEEFIEQDSTQSVKTEPFYGVWCFGSKDVSEAIQFIETLSSSGITGKLCNSSEWSNLNQEKFYVVSAGEYKTEEEAKDALKKVKELGYSDAYVKYSGDLIGSIAGENHEEKTAEGYSAEDIERLYKNYICAEHTSIDISKIGIDVWLDGDKYWIESFQDNETDSSHPVKAGSAYIDPITGKGKFWVWGWYDDPDAVDVDFSKYDY